MNASLNKLKAAVSYIQSKWNKPVQTGIILGSGLGNFVQELEVELSIPYSAIPHFPESTVEGHSGNLIFAQLSGKPVVAMSGRFHFYEGYTPEEVVFPVRVMKLLGVQTLLLSNAAGSVNPAFKVGDLMVITDHISLSIVNPLIGKNESYFGTRFPDMSEPYSKKLIATARNIASKSNIRLHEGVYYGVTGPTFETHAEYKMIRILGGDVVGMSTVQEVIVAVHAGMQVFAVSVVTDIGIREDDNVITHQEVLEAAAAAEPVLSGLFKELVKTL